MAHLLHLQALRKEYRRSRWARAPSFVLQADLAFTEPAIVGVLGPNGSGKTTLFELITGSNAPTAGSVRVDGQDIHRVRRNERGMLARHYHQSYQIRRFRSWKPEALLERAARDEPLVHLFDEPQLNTQDGYIGFMLRFFQKLRQRDRLLFVCLHPNERWQLDLMREIASRFLFVAKGEVTAHPTFDDMLKLPVAREYLGRLAD
ncbi:MAG: ATP-binding cassette domain-containing protein [Burkholderiaceae bacterium]|nr:ATP-binding cassette domain-containing protein [Burkholderiaceae bacterium]